MPSRGKIPAGSVLHCTAHFDNSTGNLSNPDPSKTVRWGPQTWEEMMIGWFDIGIPVAEAQTLRGRKSATAKVRLPPRREHDQTRDRFRLYGLPGARPCGIPKWQRDRNKGVDSPVPTQVVSNEEFIPRPQNAQQKQVEQLIGELAEEKAEEAGHGPPGVPGQLDGHGHRVPGA